MKHVHEQDEVTVRRIPATRFAAIGWLVLVLVIAAMAAWEWRMRTLGLRAGDLDDSKWHWAVERRRLESGDHDGVVIVGSSRILFDTDLDVWEEMTGRRPLQLALVGTNPRPVLLRLAEESSFSGLVVVGVTPDLYFMERFSYLPQYEEILDFWEQESPSERVGHRIGLFLSRHIAFLDEAYRLAPLIERIDIPDPVGVRRPYLEVWKLAETSADRQHRLWPRLETDLRLRDHARLVWGPFDGSGPAPETVTRAIAESRQAVETIRARGGEVVFIRAPSAGLYYENEQHFAPRARTWDRLLAETSAFGIHFEDYPEMRNLEVPEWSHLSRESATRFSRAYVEALERKMPWLRKDISTEPEQ
ncbi:MAG TPA: hypothetical protein VGA24_00830 [Steroidobacteraceae bacterium]